MKKIFTFLVLVAFLTGLEARAGVLIGSLSAVVTATTNTPTFVTNNCYLNVPQITVSHSQLATTNSFSGAFRWSFDNVTFYTNNSPIFFPSVTNTSSDTVVAQQIAIPLYIQMLAITNTANTTNIFLGVSSP
jgi:hypothetical protein